MRDALQKARVFRENRSWNGELTSNICRVLAPGLRLFDRAGLSPFPTDT